MKGRRGILVLGLVLASVIAVNVLVHFVVIRHDMTDDKRYSLSEPTKRLLGSLDSEVVVTSYLEGDLNASFKRLRKALNETLEEMEVYGALVIGEGLMVNGEGLEPVIIHERAKDGKTVQTTIYPYVSLEYKGKKSIVSLLRNNRGRSGEENINSSIENIEYALAETLHSLATQDTLRVAFIEGHGELPERYVLDLTMQLSKYAQVDRGQLGTDPAALDAYKVVIIADPHEAFSESDKYILDQYLMNGGRILWVVNGVMFSSDALSADGYTPAIPLDLNVQDMLYRYGIRIAPALIQDVQCVRVPVNVAVSGEPNYQPMPWYYAPLLLTSQASPITRNLMQVSSTFASPIEVVGGEDGIRKEVLIATSTASRLIPTPAKVDLGELDPDMETFKWQYIPVGMLLEGVFPSVFAHRLPPEEITTLRPIAKQSVDTKQIVISSGSVIRNEWLKGQLVPMGYDRYSGVQFGNRDLMVNAVLYLSDDEGLMSLRQRELTLRLLNEKRAYDKRKQIQAISIISPIALLALVVGIVVVVRKKKYT